MAQFTEGLRATFSHKDGSSSTEIESEPESIPTAFQAEEFWPVPIANSTPSPVREYLVPLKLFRDALSESLGCIRLRSRLTPALVKHNNLPCLTPQRLPRDFIESCKLVPLVRSLKSH